MDLLSDTDWSTPSRITLHGLVSLAQLSPRLRHLAIVINAADVDFASFAAAADVAPNTALDYLNVGNSPITDVEPVALVLAHVVPCLFTLMARAPRAPSELGTEAEQYSARWMEVAKKINPLFSLVDPISSPVTGNDQATDV
ncbi:hypothetical protein PLICRDRAFT_286211 [Plicaturopsis crispa FD-325 SS-3]|nr:hypothetical protein PLICRDRAFT_286211 [Plicaturopsis crispa FD-325 SS-3]